MYKNTKVWVVTKIVVAVITSILGPIIVKYVNENYLHTLSSIASKSDVEGKGRNSDKNEYIKKLPDIKVISYPGGIRYEGQLVGQVRTGYGVMTWTSGDRYEGEFVDDKQNGQGIYVFADGDRYEGEFVDDKMNGQGIYVYADGRKDKGKWVNDSFID